MTLVKATLSILLLSTVAASPQATTGVIIGIVRDAAGGVIPGATVTAIPATGVRRTVITKADGSYRIADLPVGPVRVEAALVGFDTSTVDASVRTGADTACDVTLRVMALVNVVRPNGETKPAPPEINAFVKETIEEAWDLNKIPDGNLLKGSRIAVQEEMFKSGLKLGSAALPQRPGLEFRLVPRSDTQTEADNTKKGVFFLFTDSPQIDGDTATIVIGVDVSFPKERNVVKLCCCAGIGQFEKRTNKWTFVKWLGVSCS